jgi:hypothetical protein
LNRVVHLYDYADFDARDECRRGAAASHAWQNEYLPISRNTVQDQSSSIFLPATAVLEAAKAAPIRDYIATGPGPSGLYELRTYQLHPGYDGVPKLLQAFEKG